MNLLHKTRTNSLGTLIWSSKNSLEYQSVTQIPQLCNVCIYLPPPQCFLLFLVTATLYQGVPGTLCSHPSSQLFYTVHINVPFLQMGSWGSEKLRDVPKEEKTQHIGVHDSKDVFVHCLLAPYHPGEPSQETCGPGSPPPLINCVSSGKSL